MKKIESISQHRLQGQCKCTGDSDVKNETLKVLEET